MSDSTLPPAIRRVARSPYVVSLYRESGASQASKSTFAEISAFRVPVDRSWSCTWQDGGPGSAHRPGHHAKENTHENAHHHDAGGFDTAVGRRLRCRTDQNAPGHRGIGDGDDRIDR